MRTREQLLSDEKTIIQLTKANCLPVHTEILLDIRDLLIKIDKKLK